jgi:predicted  nucleic acid-binding Zn-ribbon protein
MSDDRLRKEITTLERKVKILLSEYDRVKKDLYNYRAENQELKSVIESQKDEINGFQNKFKITKLVDNMVAGGEDPNELKSVLDQYINEIDKCIAHLSEA